MSKAEELAKKYCEGSSFENACMEKPAYIAGYHQAEKDLELTWEDVEKIAYITLRLDVSAESRGMSNQEFYQEVLKRFKTQKGEKV